jgi:hypothetical protein
MMVLGWHKRGRKIRTVGKNETSSNVGSKRIGSGRVAIDLMENINISLP